VPEAPVAAPPAEAAKPSAAETDAAEAAAAPTPPGNAMMHDDIISLGSTVEQAESVSSRDVDLEGELEQVIQYSETQEATLVPEPRPPPEAAGVIAKAAGVRDLGPQEQWAKRTSAGKGKKTSTKGKNTSTGKGKTKAGKGQKKGANAGTTKSLKRRLWKPKTAAKADKKKKQAASAPEPAAAAKPPSAEPATGLTSLVAQQHPDKFALLPEEAYPDNTTGMHGYTKVLPDCTPICVRVRAFAVDIVFF